MRLVARWITEVLSRPADDDLITRVRGSVHGTVPAVPGAVGRRVIRNLFDLVWEGSPRKPLARKDVNSFQNRRIRFKGFLEGWVGA